MATGHLHFQTQPVKPKRRRCRCRETTISADQGRKMDNGAPGLVSPDTSRYCSVANRLPPPAAGAPSYPLPSSSVRDLKILHSPSPMDHCTGASGGGSATGSPAVDQFRPSFSKFNSALTAGLLSPPQQVEKTRSSPTLFEMMANETDCAPRDTAVTQNGVVSPQNLQIMKPVSNPPPLDRQALMQQRMMDLLASRSPGNQFNDEITGDVKLNLSSKDGVSVSISVHRQILAAHSRFFSLKLDEEWGKQQNSRPFVVEIACEDIEAYFEAVGLMYCRDLRKKLMKEDVPKVLSILKVSAAIGFDAGVLSCLEYLEAAPWAEDEEERVASLLSELSLEGVGVGEVLKRVSTDVKGGNEDGNDNEEVLLKLLHTVLEGKDEKARREMKSLLTKMLRENSSQNDLRKESLYSACDGCLKSLRHHFLRAAESDSENVSQIARQADNLYWLLDILIDRQIAEDFLKTWASQSELSEAHGRVAAIHRYEVSRVTARLLVGVGKGHLLASKEARCQLLQTWLVPFYDDYGWMRRASKGLDRHLIEESLSNTILTLPMPWQQEILLSWFDRFLNAGDDCPNIQRAFQAWWRRAFWRQSGGTD